MTDTLQRDAHIVVSARQPTNQPRNDQMTSRLDTGQGRGIGFACGRKKWSSSLVKLLLFPMTPGDVVEAGPACSCRRLT